MAAAFSLVAGTKLTATGWCDVTARIDRFTFGMLVSSAMVTAVMIVTVMIVTVMIVTVIGMPITLVSMLGDGLVSVRTASAHVMQTTPQH